MSSDICLPGQGLSIKTLMLQLHIKQKRMKATSELGKRMSGHYNNSLLRCMLKRWKLLVANKNAVQYGPLHFSVSQQNVEIRRRMIDPNPLKDKYETIFTNKNNEKPPFPLYGGISVGLNDYSVAILDVNDSKLTVELVLNYKQDMETLQNFLADLKKADIPFSTDIHGPESHQVGKTPSILSLGASIPLLSSKDSELSLTGSEQSNAKLTAPEELALVKTSSSFQLDFKPVETMKKDTRGTKKPLGAHVTIHTDLGPHFNKYWNEAAIFKRDWKTDTPSLEEKMNPFHKEMGSMWKELTLVGSVLTFHQFIVCARSIKDLTLHDGTTKMADVGSTKVPVDQKHWPKKEILFRYCSLMGLDCDKRLKKLDLIKYMVQKFDSKNVKHLCLNGLVKNVNSTFYRAMKRFFREQIILYEEAKILFDSVSKKKFDSLLGEGPLDDSDNSDSEKSGSDSDESGSDSDESGSGSDESGSVSDRSVRFELSERPPKRQRCDELVQIEYSDEETLGSDVPLSSGSESGTPSEDSDEEPFDSNESETSQSSEQSEDDISILED